MSDIMEITSTDAPELAPYAKLTENQLRCRRHPENGVFIAESEPVITPALDAGCTPLSFLMEKSRIDGEGKEIIRRCPGVPVYTADNDILENLTGFRLSRGILSLMKRPVLPSVDDILHNASRIAVIEDAADSTNVGAIIRSAAALGMDAVLISPRCCDPLLRRSARVSMGTVFKIPWTYAAKSPEDWPEKGMAHLKNAGFIIVSMALKCDTVSIDDPRLKSAGKLAIILGTEGSGLSEKTVALSDYTAKIPMYHGVDSLNVAAASAVAFWETRRQG